jgi:hypothetical protein
MVPCGDVAGLARLHGGRHIACEVDHNRLEDGLPDGEGRLKQARLNGELQETQRLDMTSIRGLTSQLRRVMGCR